MLVSDYNDFVAETDQNKGRSNEKRHAIAMYGLVGEIGSLVSAIKKQLIGERGTQHWNISNDEIKEELGDVVWYCFSLAQIISTDRPVNLFKFSIAVLKKEISADNARARLIHNALAKLGKGKKDRFLREAAAFRGKHKMHLSDYQKLAFLTARTDGRILLEVCIAVLWQLGAELLRTTLPDIERTLNKSISPRSEKLVLAEIAWHVAAVASLYGLSLDDIAEYNKAKVQFRSQTKSHSGLFDESFPQDEQFPRHMEIAFVSVAPGRARMYYQGKQLGDELTDNAYEDDGYRFHDAMHLANTALLGWSPVLRSLLKRKRKSDKKVDEVEDGARARIVEELVIKAIHSEGDHLAPKQKTGHRRLFADKGQITFRLIKSLRGFVNNLEVRSCTAKDWEAAIFEGARIYHELQKEEQGTVSIDLEERVLTFSPHVCIDVKGGVHGIGTVSIHLPVADPNKAWKKLFTAEEIEVLANADDYPNQAGKLFLTKKAILQSLGITEPEQADYQQMRVTFLDSCRVSIKATKHIQERIWSSQVVSFKVSYSNTPDTLTCTALALVDPKDAVA